MITRRNLAEQLREYQLQSQQHWSSLKFWSSANRSDESTVGWWLLLCVYVLAGGSVLYYFRDIRLSLSLLGIACALAACFKTIRTRLARRRQRRILP